MQLTVLGAGSSAGTPVIGCRCATCLSDNPKNKRTRCSTALTLGSGEVILIDTGPDLRAQALREGLHRVDAILYTHTHADHLHGIDDLRAFCQLQKRQIPLYGREDAMAHISAKFGYTLRDPSDYWDLPVLSVHPVAEPFELFGLSITPIPVMHGRIEIYGYRIGDLAYVTDVSEISSASIALLKGVKTLLLDCLRYTPHFTHINLEQSIDYASLIGAEQTFLIHMTHEMEYETLSTQLPKGIFPAYDGMKLAL